MENADYFVTPASVAEVTRLLEPRCDAVIDDTQEGDLTLFVAAVDPRALDTLPLLVRVLDFDGEAWGFHLYQRGRELGRGLWGDHPQRESGFEGDVEACARALGVDETDLDACYSPQGIDGFCELLGFSHRILVPSGLPPGVTSMSELGVTADDL